MMHNNENSIKVSVGKITCGNEQNIFIFFNGVLLHCFYKQEGLQSHLKIIGCIKLICKTKNISLDVKHTKKLQNRFFHFLEWWNQETCIFSIVLVLLKAHTAWKVSTYGVFSGPYFPVFGLNTNIYEVNLRIYSVRIRENTDYKKLRIWTLFTQ